MSTRSQTRSPSQKPRAPQRAPHHHLVPAIGSSTCACTYWSSSYHRQTCASRADVPDILGLCFAWTLFYRQCGREDVVPISGHRTNYSCFSPHAVLQDCKLYRGTQKHSSMLGRPRGSIAGLVAFCLSSLDFLGYFAGGRRGLGCAEVICVVGDYERRLKLAVSGVYCWGRMMRD